MTTVVTMETLIVFMLLIQTTTMFLAALMWVYLICLNPWLLFGTACKWIWQHVMLEVGKIIAGWTCRHCPQPPRGTSNFFKHQNATKALQHVLKNTQKTSKFVRLSFPFLRSTSTKPCTIQALWRKGIGWERATKCVKRLTIIKNRPLQHICQSYNGRYQLLLQCKSC